MFLMSACSKKSMETSDTGEPVSIRALVEHPSTEALTFSVGPRVALHLQLISWFLGHSGVHK